MTPLSLTLKGFNGIHDGLGRDALTLDFAQLAGEAQLVAIAGANGRGKTTVMENMHPYLTMPSRASLAGPGGFSYYDHTYLPENEKDLVWEHGGRRYRSHIVIRQNGKRKTEAFLFLQDGAGWAPCRLPDGTVSDGRVETYERCIEALCGSADTFFTSAFSAQGKRQLTAYRNAEIKSLLADLLGLDDIRALGQQAAETAKLLNAGLLVLRHEQASLDEALRRNAAERLRLAGAAERLSEAGAGRSVAQQALERARAAELTLLAERQRARDSETRRAELISERQAAIDGSRQAMASLQAQDAVERQRLERLAQQLAARISQAQTRRRQLLARRQEGLDIVARAAAVRRACRREGLAGQVSAARSERVEQCRQRARRLNDLENTQRAALQKLAAIEREAGQAVLRETDLMRRLGLSNDVPCAGSDLQGRCKLLGDAREARALLPSAGSKIASLAEQKAAAKEELEKIRAALLAHADAPAGLQEAEQRQSRAQKRASRYAVMAARAGEVTQASAALAEIDRELALLAQGEGESPAERAERAQIGEARQLLADQRERQAAQQSAILRRIAEALAALPEPIDPQLPVRARQTIEQAAAAVAAADQDYLSAAGDVQALAFAQRQAAELAAGQARDAAHASRVESELGNWKLLAKCLGNDGVIALVIDDAGPALASLANALLLACYGPRFTVSIRTLAATGKGGQRETFDIVVHDGESDQSKSVGLMSGGERVWINECLTRAIALYLTQHSGRHYATLFSDEADGSLDPQRKRMFMDMKREVLRLGGYAREFFVSQTPELTALADAVIDLDAWAVLR